AQGHRNTTIILFTADHGELGMSHMGKSRYFEAATTTAYEDPGEGAEVVLPLRQKGPFAYEENNNVPLVVATLADKRNAPVSAYLPKRNVDVRALASSVDVIPTLVEWAGQRRAWYTRRFGRTLAALGMKTALAGVSLTRVLKTPTHYQLAQWSDGRGGRQWVLFTYDGASTLDAHYAYLAVWGQCANAQIDVTKRGMLRGLYDGRYKYVRFFSPQDYQLNGDTFAALEYPALITAGTSGQDVQLFDRSTDRYETMNTAASSTLVAELNSTLFQAMSAELRTTTRVPDTIAQVLDGNLSNCQFHTGY
ncbi:MAG: sulfatase-like hydrolase/transferase, partial [Planctomycetota bacterium]